MHETRQLRKKRCSSRLLSLAPAGMARLGGTRGSVILKSMSVQFPRRLALEIDVQGPQSSAQPWGAV